MKSSSNKNNKVPVGSSKDSQSEKTHQTQSIIDEPKIAKKDLMEKIDRCKQTENLTKNGSFFDNLIEGITDMVLVINPNDYTVVAANKVYLEKEGFTKENIVGKTCYNITHRRNEPCSLLNDKCPMEETIRTEKLARAEHIHFDKKGIKYYSEITTAPLSYKEDKLVLLLHIERDITDRKQAEEDIKRGLETVRNLLSGTIHVLAKVVETRDPYTAGHQQRVSDLARRIATEMELSDEQIEGVRTAGVVHDIGKLHIPSEILNKPGKLNELEFSMIKTHSQVGYDLLKGIEFPWPIADIVHQHHEKMDGSGYPSGLRDGDILLEARILSVADVVEAMASHRPYRPALGVEKAMEEISKNRGILFDSDVVDACLKVINEKGFRFDHT